MTSQAQKRADLGLPPACTFCDKVARVSLVRVGDSQETPACLLCARFAIANGPYLTVALIAPKRHRTGGTIRQAVERVGIAYKRRQAQAGMFTDGVADART